MCTCTDYPGDDYYCPIHGGAGCWIDLKVKADMLCEKLAGWIVSQNQDVLQSAAQTFGDELKTLKQTLLNHPLNRDEGVPVECTGGNCRGKRCSSGKGFTIIIKKSDLERYKKGFYRPVCNECFGK